MKDLIPLSTMAAVNPPLSSPLPSIDDFVSFIPMGDVSDSGEWISKQQRRLKDIGPGYTPFQEDDVLFAKITPCMENGKGCHAKKLTNGIGFGSTEFHVLRRKGENCPRFIFHWTQTEHLRLKAAAAMSGSAGQQRVEAKFFDRFLVPAMSSREQSRIAEILDTLDAAIRETEAVVAKLRQVKAGLLHDLLTRGLDEHGQLRDPERHPEQFQDSRLGRIPNGWTAEPLYAQLVGIEAGHSPSCPGFAASPGEWGVLKVSAVTHDGYVPTENKRIEDAHDVDGSCEVKVGDLLMTRCNTPELVGAACIVDQTPPCLMLCDKTLRLVVNPERDDLRYLVHTLRMPVVRRQIEISATGSSGSMKNISQDDIRGYVVPRPPADEQRRISKRVDALLARIAAEQDQLAKLHALKHGLAHDLLPGRVRVNFQPQP